MNKVKVIVSWVIVVWISYVFVNSLIFKFSGALETQYIFDTIGTWISGFLGSTIGNLFAVYGGYGVGFFELITSLVLLSPIVLTKYRQCAHFLGSMMASGVMFGAIFFHLFTPLGWVPSWTVADKAECIGKFVDPNICTDSGLANAATSIFVLSLVLMFLNKKV